MVEKIVKDYLQSSLGIPVRLEEEDDLGNEYVLIEKTGSAEKTISNGQLWLSSLILRPCTGRHRSTSG